MQNKQVLIFLAFASAVSISSTAHAWLIFFPLPNLSKPPQLEALIDALEKSEETKAVAYVSEDKVFGRKYWVWGHFSGHVTQADADRFALDRCRGSLIRAKGQGAGGVPMYDFGTKQCELYEFANKTVSRRVNEPPTPGTLPAPTQEGAAASLAAPAVVPISAPSENAVAPSVTPTTLSVPASQAAPPLEESITARKLRELNQLRKEGLITEEEYTEKRKAILSGM